MPALLPLRPVTDELRRLAYGEQVEARLREIMAVPQLNKKTVRRGIHRFTALDLAGLTDAIRQALKIYGRTSRCIRLH